MASPTVRSTNTTNGTVASATPVINLPGTIRAGDTILVAVRMGSAGAITFPAGWTKLFDDASDASDDQSAAAWRKADGTESATITLGATSSKFSSCAWAIRDAADPLVRAPEFSTLLTGTSVNPNAGLCTPTGGSKDYLFLTLTFHEGTQTSPPGTFPTGYTGSQLGADSGTAAALTTNNRVAGGTKAATAASDDAAAWTISVSDDWTATTIAFHPAVAVPAPLQTEFDRPNPLPWKQPNNSFIASSALCLLTFVPMPFRQTDWPVPPQPGQLMVTIQTLPADEVTLPFAQDDWSLPPRARTSVRTIDAVNLLLTTLADAPAATPVTPVAWPVSRPVPQRPQDAVANLLLTTLAETPSPFTPIAWPPPPPRPRVDQPATSAPAVLLASLQQAPFAQMDWPVPTARAVVRHTLTDQRRPYLVDQSPANQYDWPVPRRTPIAFATPRMDWVQNLLLGTLAVPFQPIDWPVPRRATPAPTSTSFGRSPLLDQQPAPFAQTDWPVPAPRPRATSFAVGSQPWLLTTPPPPTAQYDWPVPVRAKGNAVTWIGGNVLPLTTTQDAAPFAQTDWPVPRVAPQLARTWTASRAPHLVDESPIRQLDWPVPRVSPRLNTTIASSSLLVTTLAVPFNKTDWPVARVAARPIWTWVQPAIVTALTPIPVWRAEWPVPRPTRWTNRTWTQSAAIPVESPFIPIAWPVPSVVRRILFETTRGFTPAAAAPVVPSSWPLPTVARPRVWDWIVGRVISDATPAPPVVVVEQAPSRFGDAGTVKQAIATLLTGPAFERALVGVEQQYAGGIVLERLSLDCVKTSELVGVPAQFPWVEIVLEETQPDVQVDYADKNSHALAIVYWANGDTEEIVSSRLERYILATRRILRNETLMPMIGCFPVVRSIEEYGVVGRKKGVTSPYIKAAAISFVVTTIES